MKIRIDSVLVRQTPREQTGEGRTATRGRQVAGTEDRSGSGQLIQIRRPYRFVAHEPKVLIVLIIRYNKYDVRLGIFKRFSPNIDVASKYHSRC